MSVDPANPDRVQPFLAALTRLEQWLDHESIPHAVIGSLAVAAYIDQGRSLDFDRPHAADPSQRIPDIDLLVPRTAIGQVKAYAESTRQGGYPIKTDTFAAEWDIDFRPDADHSYLTYRTMMFPVQSRLFTPRPAPLLGQQVTTIDPRVLLHTFGTVGGVIRKKDVPKIVGLADALASGRASSQFTERDCQVFDAYMVARKRQYPVYIAAKRAWNGVLEAVPPKASAVLKHRVAPVAQQAAVRLTRRDRQRPDAER